MSDLSAEAIAGALKGRRLGQPAIYYPRIGSTNDAARQLADEGAPEGALVIADEQTVGRGRGGRSWWAPPGTSLLMSLLLRPPIEGGRAPEVTMCLGLGALEGVADATGLEASLKWPNDLMWHGRKLGGMLAESETHGGRLNWIVLGLGLNVNQRWDEGRGDEARGNRAQGMGGSAQGAAATCNPRPPVPSVAPPPEIADLAISLAMASGRPVDRLALLASILLRTELWYEQWLAGVSPHAAWSARLETLGQNVTVTLPDRILRGVAAGVSPLGALLLREEGGQVHTIWAGDVARVRETRE